MCSRVRSWIAAIFLCFLVPLGWHACLAQTPAAQKPAPGSDSATPQAAATEQQPPFDKLELFAFFAAGPIPSYAKVVIRKRGCAFTPDANFLASFAIPVVQEILRNIKPIDGRQSSPDRDAAYEFLPRALDATHHRQFAVSDENYKKALKLAPDSATLHLAYASNFLLIPDGTKAEPEARRSLELWPDNAEAHGILSLALLVEGKVAEAAEEARETLRIFPEHTSAKFQLGLALARNQQYDEAIPALRNALAVLPNLPTLHEFLGISLLRTGKTADAIEQLTSFVNATPADAEGHYFLGVALRANGRQEEAHAQFLEALRLRPNNEQFEAAAHPGEDRSPAGETSGPKPEDGSIMENIYTNKFFGFTYEFPKGWTVMSSEAARAIVEMGSVFISTGDPTDQDTKQVALKKGFPLLFVMEGRLKNQPFNASSVQVTALDTRAVTQLSVQSLLKSITERLRQAGATIQGTGSPEKLLLGGRDFWKINVTVPLGGGTRYVSEIVTFDKGFALFFVLGTSGTESLAQMEQSLPSIRFLNSPD